jgi:hypothetical protein
MNQTIADESEWIRLKAAEKMVWQDVEYSRAGYLIGHGPGRKDFKVVPSYSQDIRAAWEIVDELITEGAEVRIGNGRRGIHEYTVEIRWPGGPVYRAMHERAPMAICLAFIDCKQATKR